MTIKARRRLRSESWSISFIRDWTAPARILPDYLIIGAAKSGTSSLYRYLVKHPSVAPALRKEVHFFDLNFSKGLDWYRAHFPSVPYRYCVKKIFGHELVTGEASPYYVFHPLVAKRVKVTLPHAKIIVSLRNPVDRAYSHYQHVVKWGFETLPFEEAIEAEADRLAGEEEKMLMDESYQSFSHRHHSYLSRGIYIDQIKTWLNFFPPEQVLILCAEDLYSDPGKALNQALSFLGLSDLRLRQYRTYKQGDYSSEMDSSTRSYLVEYFEPHNQKLYEYLNMKFDWDK